MIGIGAGSGLGIFDKLCYWLAQGRLGRKLGLGTREGKAKVSGDLEFFGPESGL